MFVLGVGLFYLVLRHFGFQAILHSLSKAAPASLCVFLFYPFMTLWDVASWKFCFSERLTRQVSWGELFLIRLAGEAVNNITPFIDVGGEPLKIYLLSQRFGIPASSATSATVVARTSLMLSEAFFLMLGVLLSFELIPMPVAARWQLTAVLFAVCAAFFGFLFIQQREWLRKINPEISQYYRTEPVRFWTAVPLNWMGWVSGGIETYFLCRLMGLDISVLEAVMLESLLQLIRTGSFFVPGNFGVQEAGMALFMGHMGFDPATGVGISLLKRFRQILWSLVGFLVWGVYQYKEAKKREVPLKTGQLLSFDTWLDRHIHRPPAEFIAFLLSKTPITPNQVTLCTLPPAILAGAFFAIGGFPLAVVGLVFFYVWSVTDHVDGSLARRKQLFSKWGQRLDDSCDNLASTIIFLGIFFGLLRLWNEKDQCILQIIFYLALSVNVLAGILVTYTKRRVRHQALKRHRASEGFLWKQRLLDSLTGRDAFYFFIGLVLVTYYFGPSFWPFYTFTMGFFIISVVTVSSISLSEFFRR